MPNYIQIMRYKQIRHIMFFTQAEHQIKHLQLSVAIQHEMDHLDGHLFIERIGYNKSKKFDKEEKRPTPNFFDYFAVDRKSVV